MGFVFPLLRDLPDSHYPSVSWKLPATIRPEDPGEIQYIVLNQLDGAFTEQETAQEF
jgi:hypothetical protein